MSCKTIMLSRHSFAEGNLESSTYAVAMPLHRARVLSATRSPRRSFLAGPRTVATLTFILLSPGAALSSLPSSKCHSTLYEDDVSKRAHISASHASSHSPAPPNLLEDLLKEWHTGEHATTLGVEVRLALFLADHVATPIERGRVLREPCCHYGRPGGRKEMCPACSSSVRRGRAAGPIRC